MPPSLYGCVVFSHSHYSAHLLALRLEPTGPQRPVTWPPVRTFLFAGLLWLLQDSQPMSRSFSVRCAYFVEEPINNSLPKPQKFKSQVHNCSLNQSANFVVSVLQTVGLESFLHKERLWMYLEP